MQHLEQEFTTSMVSLRRFLEQQQQQQHQELERLKQQQHQELEGLKRAFEEQKDALALVVRKVVLLPLKALRERESRPARAVPSPP